MKKISLILTFLLVLSLLFASCNKNNHEIEVTTSDATENTTTMTTTVATTTALPEPTDGITIGTTKKEVRKRFSNTMPSIWNGPDHRASGQGNEIINTPKAPP